MDKMEKKGLAIGAVIGAVLGVITGILFAPKSGKETREDIKVAANKAASKVYEEANKIIEEAKEVMTKAETNVKDLSGRASKVAKDKLADLKKTVSHLTTVAKSFKEGEASDEDLNKAIKKVKEAQKSLKTYMQK